MTAQPTGHAPDANDVLMGGTKVAPAKLDQQGVIVGGRIVAPPKAHQEREYDPAKPGQGAPKFFPSGDPIYGLTVDVQTNERNPQDPDDTGIRRIWVEGKRLKTAVANAVRDAGAQKLEVGGTLEVAFVGLGEASGPGVNPPKEYQARYQPPGASQADVFGQAQGQQPAQQAAPQQPAWGQQAPPAHQQPAPPQAPAQAAPQAGPTAEQVAAVRAAGLDPAVVFAGQQLPA